jgi:hypothetical protein
MVKVNDFIWVVLRPVTFLNGETDCYIKGIFRTRKEAREFKKLNKKYKVMKWIFHT